MPMSSNRTNATLENSGMDGDGVEVGGGSKIGVGGFVGNGPAYCVG